MLIENPQPLLHQYIVIRNIPGGCPQRFNAGFFGKGDPYFRDQYTFKIKTGNFHGFSRCRLCEVDDIWAATLTRNCLSGKPPGKGTPVPNATPGGVIRLDVISVCLVFI